MLNFLKSDEVECLVKDCCAYRQACEVTQIMFMVLHCDLMQNSACLHQKMVLFVSGVKNLVIPILYIDSGGDYVVCK